METTEELALAQVARWANEYGWKGTMFTRDDVRQAVIDQYGESPTLDLQVERVMDTGVWRKYLEEAITREGMECIYEAISDVERVTP